MLSITLCSCKKEWLDIKPDKGLSVPETLNDFQAILDDPDIMNCKYSFSGNPGTDSYYIAPEDLGNFFEYDRDLYFWADKITWPGESSNEWNNPYSVIKSSNIVLDGITKFDQENSQVKLLKGQAMFFRAFAYYNLAQIFCVQYEKGKAEIDLGLPLRLNAEVNELQKRSNLQQVYDLIISDLKQASEYLKDNATYFTRPTKIAAQAMLSKVYLNMQDYNNARIYADSVLNKKPALIDFNNNNQVSHYFPYKFPQDGKGNPEIIFFVFANSGYFQVGYLGHFLQAEKKLFDLYDENDLRKEYFFGISANKINFISSYVGTGYEFGGIATNEIYLIRAEANARLNNLPKARQDLNKLLNSRYKTNLAPIITETNHYALLRLILNEKRKELPHTGNLRWEDLRRLNLDPQFAITLKRTSGNKTNSLLPNSTKYTLNIPNNEIRISGIEQNKR